MEYQIVTKVSKKLQQNNLEIITNVNEYLKEYLKKGIYLQKKDKKLLIILILI